MATMQVPALRHQVASIALIDDLRHRQRLVEEHLDLPGQRRLIENKISEYYAATGVVVSPGLIKEGVAEYFSGRLQFEAPKIGRIQSLLAKLYMTRAAWRKEALFYSALVLLLNGLWFFGINAYEEKLLKIARDADLHKITYATNEATSATAQAAALLRRSVIVGYVNGEKLSQTLLDRGMELAPRLADLSDPTQNLAAREKQATALLEKLAPVTFQIQSVDSLISAKEKLERLLQAEDSQRLFGAAPQLENLLDTANKALNTADPTLPQSVSAATSAVNTFISKAGTASKVAPLRARIKALDQSVAAMNLDADAKGKWARLVDETSLLLNDGEISKARDVLGEMTAFEAFARSPLTFKIVDRPGIKSGVERAFKQGKSWYLVVEGLAPGDTPIAVPVKSIETGEAQYTKLFAVRVSKSTYDKVREDKLNDGHVDNSVLGKKPANSMKMNLKDIYGDEPQMITKW